MSTWTAVLVASGVCFLIKFAGYLMPHTWLENPVVARLAARITIAMLAALVAVQTLASGRSITIDERVPAVLLAAFLLWRRAPFIVVVLAAGALAAILRLF